MNASRRQKAHTPWWIKVFRMAILLFFILFVFPLLVPIHLCSIERIDARALNNGRLIYFDLRMYAGDHDGKFPELNGAGNSNEALQVLIKEGYTQSKRLFFDRYSPFTPTPPPENDPDPTHLSAGQNAFAYVPNLTDSDNPALPLLATAFKEGHIGAYDAPAKYPSFFSRWQTPPAHLIYPVIVHLDGSARSLKSRKASDGSYRIYGHTTDEGKSADIFEPAEGWLKENQRPVNPASPPKVLPP